MDSRTVIIGEVGLGGEVRPVSQVELRIREAVKLGFNRCILPERNLHKYHPIDGMDVVGIQEIGDVLGLVMDHG